LDRATPDRSFRIDGRELAGSFAGKARD